MGIGYPSVKRKERNFDCKSEPKGQKEPKLFLETKGNGQPIDKIKTLSSLEITIQNGDQHQDTSYHCIENELEGRHNLSARAPNTNQEIHRDQHHFPKDIKKKKIQGGKCPHHTGLQNEHQKHVFFELGSDFSPGRQNNQGHQKIG